MDQEKIGKFIAECRKTKNLSQSDLANKLGITNKAVSKWENGRCMPDISLLEPLANILEVSINEIIKGEKINKLDKSLADENINKALKYYEKAKRRMLIFKVICLVIAYFILKLSIIFAVLAFSTLSAKIIEIDDISKYNQVIGSHAKNEYQNKWGMSEEIFPEYVTNLNVQDFKSVYYDPWDAQYLSYLVIDYDEEEVNRLKSIGIDDYMGIYGVSGFNDNYELLAMETDNYHGFVYAITDQEKIIYVELIFCNYFYDIDYEKYISWDYLPKGFNAKENNPYRKKIMGE